MDGLRPADLLALWEDGTRLHTIDRALRMLQMADPTRDATTLPGLPLGERDALLLAMRRVILGDRLDAQTECPECHERVEFDVSCSALIGDGEPPPPTWRLDEAGVSVTLRPLDSIDAAAAAADADAETAYETLLACSIVSARSDGQPVDAASLSPPLRAAIASSVASHDQHAEVLIDLTCPACGHRWQSVLDIASFLWTELAARARRVLLDVHALAGAYGWRESDVLALSPTRRAAYVALVND